MIKKQRIKNKWVKEASPPPEPISPQTQTGPRLYDPDATTYYEPTSENVSLQLLIDSHNEQVKVSEIHKEIALDKLKLAN